jgi:pimeloyl-ACP methyl ester carboxylesterase
MDHWDPALVNPLAAARPLLLIDNAGVGYSDGEVPKSIPAWAENYLSVLNVLGVQRVDVLGYSMGGCVAQLMALNGPQGLVRRLILCGTTPSSGEGVVTAPLGPFNQLKAATTMEEHRAAFLSNFFVATQRSQAAGRAAWDRQVRARPVRVDYVPAAASHKQAIAFAKFMDPKQADAGTYNRLHELQIPVLIANGE